MHFPGRELKDYAEPVSAETLKPMNAYFVVQFLDPEMFVPLLEPVIYLGRNLRTNDKDLYYFQKYESYAAGVRRETATQNEVEHFQALRSNEMNHIYEYERALEILMDCSLKRKE